MKINEKVPHGEIGHVCDGACAQVDKGAPATAGIDGVQKNPHPEPPKQETGTAGVGGMKHYAEGGMVDEEEEADPSDIPEDIKEFIEAAHKAQRESRPDEDWHIAPAKKEDPIAPYKQDEESNDEEPSIMDSLRSLTMSGGGRVPGYAEGGEVNDDQAMLGMPPTPPLPDAGDGGLSQIAALSGITPPPAAPPTPAPVAPPPAAPIVPRGTPPAATDADFMNKASNMLGLNPGNQASFMKLLGDRSQKGQIGAGIAGIGDAIASGGTLGKVNPNGLANAETLIQNKEKSGLEGMQTLHQNQEKTVDLSLKLQAQDPNSPLSRWAQKSYAGLGKKLGLDLSHASASVIGDLSGKGVTALNDEAELGIKQTQLGLQKQQVDATIGNQKEERRIAQEAHQLDAAKALDSRGIFKKAADLIPGTSGHTAKTVLEETAMGITPDVKAYAERHGISPEAALAIKTRRTGGR